MGQFTLDFEFLRGRYDAELLRKEQLSSSLTLPVAALSVLGGVIVAMAQSFSYSERMLTLWFVICLGLGVLAFCACLVYFARSYHSQLYVYLPLLDDLENSRREFLAFAPVMAGGEGEVLAAFEQQMRQRLIDAADRNCRTNDVRSGLLHRGRLALFAVLLLSAFTGVPYVADAVRIKMANESESAPPEPTKPAPAGSVQLPTVPPNREIREGDVPRQKTGH